MQAISKHLAIRSKVVIHMRHMLIIADAMRHAEATNNIFRLHFVRTDMRSAIRESVMPCISTEKVLIKQPVPAMWQMHLCAIIRIYN